MTDEEIVKRAKDAEKRTVFGESVHSPVSRGVNSAYGIGFIEGMVEYRTSLQEKPVSEELEEAADVYSKVFSDIAAPYIRKDAFIAGANWQKEQDLIPSTELSNFIDKLSKQFPEVSFAKLSRIAVRVAKWQQQQEYTCYEEAFEDGAKWKAEQFEKNRLKHCDSITNEQAELEQGFIDQHLDKYQRMPTFLDAIEYGMQTMKEQMMKGAIDAKIGSFANGTIYDADFNIDSNLKDNDKVKVIVIKEA